MQPPLPSATPTWHNDTYAAISPTRPELSAAGKTVVITGAGSGIGRETAAAFASAGASRIALLGRTEESLKQTAAELPSSVSVSTHVVDVKTHKSLAKAAKEIGTWHILVLGAGYVSPPCPIATSAFADFWSCFETNTKGTYASLHSFMPFAESTHAAVIAMTSGAAAFPATMVPGLSVYMASKLAQTKLIEFLATENPNIFAVTVHPGMIETATFHRSGAKADSLPMDKVQLPAHFIVWLSSQEAAFLNGRSVWANWDVNELKVKADAIQQSQIYTAGINGWPFSP